jgi:hypothetical protein
MKELFKDILSIEDVEGIMLFSFEGELIFKQFLGHHPKYLEKKEWWGLLVKSLVKTREADLIFEKKRLYIRRTDLGYLIIPMTIFAQNAMVRLNCDIIQPSLKKDRATKGIVRFFKKNRS